MTPAQKSGCNALEDEESSQYILCFWLSLISGFSCCLLEFAGKAAITP